MHKILSLIVVLSSFGSWGCATNNSAKVRSQRPITLGLSTGGIGGMYRPSESYAVGVTTGGTSSEGETMTIYSPANQKKLGADEFDVLETQTSTTNLFAHYYPWKDSAFYMGLRLSKQDATFIYEVQKEGAIASFNGDEIATPIKDIDSSEGATLVSNLSQVSLETSSTQIKIPIGWSWIWENGISFMLELGGPVISFEQSSSYSLSGETEGVNKTTRDLLASELKSTVGKDSAISPFMSFGYSF